MVLLSKETRKKNTFEGNKSMFLNTLDEIGWQDFLTEFNQKVEQKVRLDDFKDELWDTVVGFGETVLMATGMDEKARGELLDKLVCLREKKQSAEAKSCKDSSTPIEKTDNEKIRVEIDDRSKTSTLILIIIFQRLEKGGGQDTEEGYLDNEVDSVMILTTPPSKGVRSMKRNWEVEEASTSVEAVSGKNFYVKLGGRGARSIDFVR